jgi:hypothetical protein
MAIPSTTFTEMVTSTLRHHPSVVNDAVSKHNALYRRLSQKKNIELVSGGYELVENLDYQNNATYQRFSGFDTLNIGQSDVLTAAKYEWVQAAINVVASGRELLMNSGPEAIFKLSKARITNALRTAANNMSTDMYSNGGLQNQMGGLQLLIQPAGTGTVGGIDSGQWSFWQNQTQEIAGTSSKTTIKGGMDQLWLNCVRGTDKPDLIVMTHDFFSYYWENLQDLQRYMQADEGMAGFTAVKFMTADVIFDSDPTNFTTTGETGYFINTDYLKLVVHKDANWTVSEEKMSVNQDATVIPLYWMGQLVTSNRARQGILTDSQA